MMQARTEPPAPEREDAFPSASASGAGMSDADARAAAEVRARAAHWKRQREALLARKAEERARQLAEHERVSRSHSIAVELMQRTDAAADGQTAAERRLRVSALPMPMPLECRINPAHLSSHCHFPTLQAAGKPAAVDAGKVKAAAQAAVAAVNSSAAAGGAGAGVGGAAAMGGASGGSEADVRAAMRAAVMAKLRAEVP